MYETDWPKYLRVETDASGFSRNLSAFVLHRLSWERKISTCVFPVKEILKYLPTAFFRSAKKRRTLLGLKAAPNGLGPPEFRVRYAVLTPLGRFKFDCFIVKLKQEVLN
jgi:hypothetical protein